MDRKRDELLKAFHGLKACTLSATISRPNCRPAFDELGVCAAERKELGLIGI